MSETSTEERYLKLADFCYKSFNDRRSYEWKFLLAAWGAVLIVAHKDWSFPPFGWWGWLSYPFAFLSAVAVYITWISGCWAANQSDKDRQELFFKKAISAGGALDGSDRPQVKSWFQLRMEVDRTWWDFCKRIWDCGPVYKKAFLNKVWNGFCEGLFVPFLNWSNCLQTLITFFVFMSAAHIIAHRPPTPTPPPPPTSGSRNITINGAISGTMIFQQDHPLPKEDKKKEVHTTQEKPLPQEPKPLIEKPPVPDKKTIPAPDKKITPEKVSVPTPPK